MGLASLLMEEGAIPPRDTQEVGRGILGAGQLLEGLIEKFLAYAELHAATPVIDPGLQAEKALETAREESTHRALRANRSADLDVSGGEPVAVPMTSHHWRLLVRELVDNALKFSRAGSPVTVGLTTRRDRTSTALITTSSTSWASQRFTQTCGDRPVTARRF